MEAVGGSDSTLGDTQQWIKLQRAHKHDGE